jgi:UV DNA damage endonuclease
LEWQPVIVRFGYVAMSTEVKNASPSKTMTFTHFSQLADREAAIRKLERIASENLSNTLRILRHNYVQDIHLYRFSSRLIPLLGHPQLADWDPFSALVEPFAHIGEFVRKHAMRVSFHPDHFTVLNTPKPDVLRSSVSDLSRHVRMFEAMGLDEQAKCNIHIGGTYGDKASASERFIKQFTALDPSIKRRLTLENDDKTFTASETLLICEKLQVPMVLDIHHHQVNNDGESYTLLWPRIHQTWRWSVKSDNPTELPLPPKIHASSPKSGKDPRAHADYVEVDGMLAFFRAIAGITPRLDVMLEAKMKDGALFKLMDELSGQEGVQVTDKASIEINT